MSIITNPETNQQPSSQSDNEGAWSRLGVVYGSGEDKVHFTCYFHPVHKPLRLFLNGKEAVIVPVTEADSGTT